MWTLISSRCCSVAGSAPGAGNPSSRTNDVRGFVSCHRPGSHSRPSNLEPLPLLHLGVGGVNGHRAAAGRNDADLEPDGLDRGMSVMTPIVLKPFLSC
jgi:hypothetical protein